MIDTTNTYGISFRCYFPGEPGTNYSTHYQRIPLSELPLWVEAYRFTHPNCYSITAKVWLNDTPQQPCGED